MKHLFIVNPVSGGKKHNPEKTEADIKQVMENSGKNYEIYFTKEPKDAEKKVIKASESGEKVRVYACGGDGTLNECVSGAVGRKNVSVTHYPCGTGNDFIKMFGEEKYRFFDLKELVEGSERPLDIIDCGNGNFGLNIASVGIDARIGYSVHEYSHIVPGAGAYIFSTLVNIFKGINQRLTISYNNKTITGKFAMISACNGRFYGGSFNPVPDAVPDDGLIDFLIVKEVRLLKFASLVGKYAGGKYKEMPEYITHVRTDSLSIECDEEMMIGFDGEGYHGKKVTFQVVPKGVQMFFPANMKFFAAEETKTADI